MSDLKPFLEAGGYSSQIKLFYEETKQRDRIHAERLAGLPGVTLCPQRSAHHHFLLRQLAASSAGFSGMLATLLGVFT
jgi:hypothetical protein